MKEQRSLPDKLLDLSVIVVNWNGGDDLLSCLASLAESAKNIQHEVLLVDNASTDDSTERAQAHFAEVILIRNDENLGFAAAVNQAIEHAQGEFLLLLNPDAQVEQENLSLLLSVFRQNEDIGIVGVPSNDWQGRKAPAYELSYPGERHRPIARSIAKDESVEVADVAWVSGACLLARRRMVEQIGPLDAGFFMYYEDVDWCRRARLAGWRVVTVPGVAIRHTIGGSSGRVPPAETARRTARSRLRFYWKHFPTRRARWLTIQMAGSNLLQWCVRLVPSLFSEAMRQSRHANAVRLQEALAVLLGTGERPSTTVTQAILASAVSPNRRRKRRNKAAFGGLVVFLLIASVLAFIRPVGSAIMFSLLTAVIAWLLGYFLVRKARKHRQRFRPAIAVGIIALVLTLSVSQLVARRAFGARLGNLSLVLVGVCHLMGLALGIRKNRQPARPAQESALAHQYLDGLKGLEIGGGIHNPFGLNTWNLDYSAATDTIYKKAEIAMLGRSLPVDIVGLGDELPFVNESLDFVLASHVLEHLPDPIKALEEWFRVVRSGGYIFMIVPHKERTFDRDRPRTKLTELVARHQSGCFESDPPNSHYSVWITEDVVALINYLGWPMIEVYDVDDKAGNGFTVVIRKP